MSAACPLCGGEWPDHELREDGNILANATGYTSLVGVGKTIFRAVKRPGGATMLQLEELTGTSPESIKVTVYYMNKYKLARLGKRVMNVSGRGMVAARYVLREVRQ